MDMSLKVQRLTHRLERKDPFASLLHIGYFLRTDFTGCPEKVTLPVEAGINSSNAFMNVDFPAPFGPMIPVIFCDFIVKLMVFKTVFP